MILIWSGHGYLVPVATFGSCLAMEFFTRSVFNDNDYYRAQIWPIPTALEFAGLISLTLDWALTPAEPLPEVLRTESNIPARKPSRNTLFWIPMKVWAILLFCVAIGVVCYRLQGGAIE